MTKHVRVIFDRRKKAAKVGTGFIDICVYLKEGQRKFEIVGSSTPEEWEVVAQDRKIQAKVKHYELIINAMKQLNEEMTIANFNQHVFQDASPKKPEDKVLYNGTDLRQSFVEFCRDHMEHENLAKNSIVLTEALVYLCDGIPTGAVLLDTTLLHEEENQVLLLLSDFAEVLQVVPKVQVKSSLMRAVIAFLPVSVM